MIYNDKINYKYENNPSSNTLVILLHGLTMSIDLDPIKSLFELIKDKHSVLTFDFLAHGKSYGNSLDITIKKEIEDAKELIDLYINDFENVVFIGHSLGGVIANYLANFYHAKKAILLAPAFNIYNDLMNGLFFGKKIKENKTLQIWNMKFSYDFFINAKNEEYYKIYLDNIVIIHGKLDQIVPIDSILPYSIKTKLITLDDDHEFTNNLKLLLETVIEYL